MRAATFYLHGGMDARTDWLPLRSGPLVLHFDPETAALRGVRLGDREVVRAIYGAVRDRNWETVAPILADLRVEAGTESFRLTFDAHCQRGDVDFAWRGEVSGDAGGTLTYRMTGQARSTFWRNRIGLCLLHPIRECAGQACVIETVAGETLAGVFPDAIAPHQPFENLRAIAHAVSSDVWTEARLDGETFEMEDQRNWTDASFKTYGTPLTLPFPVEIRAGTEVAQTITMTLSDAPPGAQNRNARTRATTGGALRSGREAAKAPATRAEMDETPIVLRFAPTVPLRLPAIGLGIAGRGAALTETETARLRALALAHLRLDLTLSAPGWEARLERATDEARALGVGLEIALFLTDAAEAELPALRASLERFQPPVARWLIFHAGAKSTPREIILQARRALADYAPNAPMGAGTNAYFAELNRERPPCDSLDFACYSLNPQVHVADAASLVENLEAQGATVRSAQAFCPDRPVVVSPITLKPRFNPNATETTTAPPPTALPPEADARQASLLGAGWTLGSLQALCESQPDSLTYYETTGRRGVMAGEPNGEAESEIEAATGNETDAPRPAALPSLAGAVFPLYHVFADVGAFAGGEVLPLVSPSGASGRVAALALRAGRRHGLLCANLTPSPQSVRLVLSAPVLGLSLRQIEESGVEHWMRAPEAARQNEADTLQTDADNATEWTLPPYAYARLDWQTTAESASAATEREAENGGTA